MKPLTDLQKRVLQAISELEKTPARYAFSPNEIGYKAGAKKVTGGGRGGRGRGYRSFGPAQQIIRTLTSLKQRGLIADARRDDGRSGSAYYLTDEGQRSLNE